MRNIFFITLIVVFCPLFLPLTKRCSAKNRTKKRIKSGAKNSGAKVKGHETTPFSKTEQKIISLGGIKIVKQLRKYGYDAKNYYNAVKGTLLGIRLYNKGDYGDSIFVFKRYFRKFPSPSILYHVAEAYLRFGNRIKALDNFEMFLEKSKSWKVTSINPILIQKAGVKIKRLKNSLASLKIKMNIDGSEMSINGVILRHKNKTLKSPFTGTIWLKPGYNQINITHKGYITKSIIIPHAKKGKLYQKKVELVTPREMIRRSRLFKMAQLEKLRIQKRKQQSEARLRKVRREALLKIQRRRKMFRIAGYSASVTGGVILATGLILGAVSDNIADNLNNKSTGTLWADMKDDYDRYRSYRTYSRYIMGAGAVVLISGATFIYLGIRRISHNNTKPNKKRKSRKLSIVPMISSNTKGVALSFRF